MKQTTLLAAFALAVTAWATPSAEACSDLIVGKKASVDGSVMISYSADSHTLYGDLVHYPAKAWGQGPHAPDPRVGYGQAPWLYPLRPLSPTMSWGT